MSKVCVDQEHRGTKRLHFFLGKVGLFALWTAGIVFLGPESPWLRAIGLVLSYVSFWLEVMRLRNAGLSRWWTVLRFVPYANVLYLIFLQSAPANWAMSRRFDRTGKTLLIFQLALLALIILMILKTRAAMPWYLG